MNRLAKKNKQEEAKKGAPEWMATFSDLMNLLLCFFVLLFSMSSIDAEKYELIRASLNNSISIFMGGSSAIQEGDLINSGISQLNELSEYYNVVGETSANTGEETEEADTMEEQLLQEKKKYSEEMYDEISELSEENNLSDYVNLSIDPDYNFVKLSISGSVLFDSGRAEIKEEAKPILSKVGDILKVYDTYLIEIEGHTDNVKIVRSKTYKNNNWLSSARALNAAEYLIQTKGLDPKTLKYSGRGEYEPVASNSDEKGRAQNRRVEVKIYNELSSR